MSDTLSAYDLWSRTYDVFANPMIAMTVQALAARPLDVSGCRVLELGCGTGRNLPLVLDSGAKSYTGIDGSEGMLEKAELLTDDRRVFWMQANLLEPLPLAAGTADFVLIALVLEHFRDIAPLLKEAGRLLAPGGKLRIFEIHPTLVAQGTQAHFWHEGREVTIEGYAHDANEFRAALESAGLQVEAIEDLSPSETTLQLLPKLEKHEGKPVLLDISARKP